MAYTVRDMGEAAIGAFSAVIFFFAVREGEPLGVDPMTGFLIGLVWVGLIYWANRGPERLRMRTTTSFVGNLTIVVLLTALLSVAFQMASPQVLMSFEYFGSAAWIAVWFGLPIAMLFDMNNFTNVLSRYYAHNRRI